MGLVATPALFRIQIPAANKVAFALAKLLIFFRPLCSRNSIQFALRLQMNPSPYPVPFSSAHLRANIVKVLLIVGAIATGLSLITEALSIAFPFGEEQELGDNPLGAVLALVIFLLAVFELIIYVTTVVFFCVWLYRAYDNLRAFDPSTGLDYSPAMAVGSFFIPFANLVIPYRAVKEVWQKSGIPEEMMLSLPDAPARFPVWWMFWLLGSFVGNISMRLSFNENVSHTTATLVGIAASALSIVAAVFAYLVVDAIDKRQEVTTERLQLGRFARPQPPPANLGSQPIMNEGSFSGQ